MHLPEKTNGRTPARDSPLCPRDPNAKEAAASAQGADGISQPPRDNLLTPLRTHRCVRAPPTRNMPRPAPKAQPGTSRKTYVKSFNSADRGEYGSVPPGVSERYESSSAQRHNTRELMVNQMYRDAIADQALVLYFDSALRHTFARRPDCVSPSPPHRGQRAW
ncbi:hypothetical protein B0H17DRAFT_1213003 [Mycena rosella]|uniref:Uncharacterized protein n=1 Tax=Mycena rosella TaxID=1033263 RepID=A0AAD7G4M6_MYCRO|nr:hypothetical protein B0H17DRAFT_1213003 [Mycena rosella]